MKSIAKGLHCLLSCRQRIASPHFSSSKTDSPRKQNAWPTRAYTRKKKKRKKRIAIDFLGGNPICTKTKIISSRQCRKAQFRRWFKKGCLTYIWLVDRVLQLKILLPLWDEHLIQRVERVGWYKNKRHGQNPSPGLARPLRYSQLSNLLTVQRHWT